MRCDTDCRIRSVDWPNHRVTVVAVADDGTLDAVSSASCAIRRPAAIPSDSAAAGSKSNSQGAIDGHLLMKRINGQFLRGDGGHGRVLIVP